jgi:hypothetical protein
VLFSLQIEDIGSGGRHVHAVLRVCFYAFVSPPITRSEDDEVAREPVSVDAT